MLRPRVHALSAQAVRRQSVLPNRREHTSAGRRGWLKLHINQLRARYPQIDTPSLVASFLILHELTAVIPLFAGFWTLKTLGVGAAVVGWIAAETTSEHQQPGWITVKTRQWIQQGQEQAETIGRRYGVFGYAKETPEQRIERKQKQADSSATQSSLQVEDRFDIGGDVANLVGSYVIVKD
ncbi:hypothetical protein OIV83_003670 [Microbotryomycetes sp. JL201]|nr:hypothetical protein OIV83_003670 [Microbotryomycetes sp. JL201]